MADVEGAMPLAARQELRASFAATKHPLIEALPKVELHVHIEGTLTPELKWKFSQRNGQTLKHPRTGAVFNSLDELQASHDVMKKPAFDDGDDDADGNNARQDNNEETLSFFEAYYGGFEVLKTRQDYFDLAMHYFERAARMNVRYCEIFFDPQGHTKTGVSWETMMGGFRKAQEKAEKDLNVKSAWIMCFLRDESPQSAMEHYLASLAYRDMIIGVGLDSNEDQRPPILFEEVFARARADGLRLTAHCDVGKTYPLEHIRQVATEIGGGSGTGTGGAERIDHGQNAAEDPELVELISSRNIGMTICPWSCIRHQPFDETFERIRVLFDAGIKLAVGSDDPTFMEDTWIHENLLLVERFCGFDANDMVRLAQDAVDISWAPEEVKKAITDELQDIRRKFVSQ